MGESKDEGYWDSLSISEIARLLHVPQSTLRYYEDEGLVTPVRTESGGWRRYSLLSLVELGDILFYRSIGIPVKDIKGLMDSPVKETASAVDRAIDETVEQMQGLGKTLDRLSLYNRRIREFYMVQARGSRLVERPEVDVLHPFGMKEEASLQAYLDDLATSYCFFIEDASSPDAYVDCASKPTAATAAEPIWRANDQVETYLECLVRTDYCYAERNDVARHVEHLRSMGLEPGAVIAQYLTFDYSEEDGKRYDYYRAWIEARRSHA